MFNPQFIRPEQGDPYYNKPLNPCIYGNWPAGAKKKTGYPGLNVLRNCVGYAVGRFNAIGGYGKCRYLGNTNAGMMVALALKQGLKVTLEPTLGGAMVWDCRGGAGHIAIVEKRLFNNGKVSAVVTSESEWNGSVFRTFTRQKADGNWRDGCYWMSSKYRYIGCINNPAVEDIEMMTIDELIEQMTPEQAYKLNEKAVQYSATLPVSNYAANVCKKAVEIGAAADGNGDGTVDAPKSPLLRQEFFVFLSRLGLLK